jgi:hypothetical protein
MQRSGLRLMVRPETSMVSRCPPQAPSSQEAGAFLQARRGSRGRAPDISPQESDEKEVTLCRRKTTTERSQRREHCQLHPWVHLRDTFRLALF